MRIARAMAFTVGVTLIARALSCTSFGSSPGSAESADAGAPHPVDAAVAAPDGAVEWVVNHHKYLFVPAFGITYEEAKADAVAIGGHLVTLTAPEEGDFVFRMLSADLDASFYRANTSDNWRGPWLGAERIPDSGAADARYAWTWVTPEPFDFAAWLPSEPTDQTGVDEPRAVYLSPSDGPPTASWADVWPTFSCSGYVVEFE
jgi:hypothetical protein